MAGALLAGMQRTAVLVLPLLFAQACGYYALGADVRTKAPSLAQGQTVMVRSYEGEQQAIEPDDDIEIAGDRVEAQRAAEECLRTPTNCRLLRIDDTYLWVQTQSTTPAWIAGGVAAAALVLAAVIGSYASEL